MKLLKFCDTTWKETFMIIWLRFNESHKYISIYMYMDISYGIIQWIMSLEKMMELTLIAITAVEVIK